jgi:hypothetical protein
VQSQCMPYIQFTWTLRTCRNHNAHVQQDSVPVTLLRPVIDIILSAEKLDAIPRKIGLQDLVLLFAQGDRWS